MFASFGRARTLSAVTFTSRAALAGNLAEELGLTRSLVAVEHTRDIGKKNMMRNHALPKIEVDPETYEVEADGELLTCAPAEVLPMAQRYFMY
jgi:urease subunit alpha